jgi:hypothetical protein
MFKEQQFWKWFGNNSDRLFQLEEEYRDTIFRELSKQLHKVNKGLAFAFSNIRENGKREFVVSADGNKKLFPKVLKLVESAPSFGTWEVVAFRQPVGCFDVNLLNAESAKVAENDFTKLRVLHASVVTHIVPITPIPSFPKLNRHLGLIIKSWKIYNRSLSAYR